MKKMLILLLSALFLVACSSGETSLKNSNDVLFEVGDQKITTNQLYNMLRNQETGVQIINIAKQHLIDAKVPVSDDMKVAAEETYKEYEELYGDFMSYVTGGLSKEEFIEQQLVPFEQEKAYLKPYFEAEYDTVFEEDPAVRVYYLQFTDLDTVKAALEDLKSGKTWEEIKELHLDEKDTQSIESKLLQTSSTTVPKELLQWALKNNVVDGDINPDYFTDSSNTSSLKYLIAQIDTKDKEQLKEDYFFNWLNDTDRVTEIYADAFQKADFKVYDAILHEQIRADEDYRIFLP